MSSPEAHGHCGKCCNQCPAKTLKKVQQRPHAGREKQKVRKQIGKKKREEGREKKREKGEKREERREKGCENKDKECNDIYNVEKIFQIFFFKVPPT